VRGHHAVGHPVGDQGAVRLELDRQLGGVGHVREALVRVAPARAVAGEVLEGGEHPRLVHALDECPRVRGHPSGIGRVRPPQRDDRRIGRVDRDVHHRGEIPVDAGLAQHGAHAARLGLGEGGIVALAQLLRGPRGRVAQAW
jgi:hypothetical protein